jgi:hypothetical protein
MMIVVLIIVALAALFTVIYINRPQFAKEGESCDSSSKGCAKNLECINNICSIKFDDRYELLSNTICNVEGVPLTSDPSLAATGSIEDFAKIVAKKCDDKNCKAFMLFKDPQPADTVYWKKGFSYPCRIDTNGNVDGIASAPISDLYRLKSA